MNKHKYNGHGSQEVSSAAGAPGDMATPQGDQSTDAHSPGCACSFHGAYGAVQCAKLPAGADAPPAAAAAGPCPAAAAAAPAPAGAAPYLESCPNLDTPEYPEWHQVFACEPSYYYSSCGCRTKVVKTGCHTLSCPSCADFNTLRRARGVFDRFKDVPEVCYTVFTVPVEVRELFAKKSFRKNALRSLRKVLKRDFGLQFGFEAIHPCGDKSPTVFAPHLNLIWKRGSGAIMSGWLSPEKLEYLKSVWAQILEVSAVDVHHQFVRPRGKLWHRCKYVARAFPEWAHWTPPTCWIGHYPHLEKLDHGSVCDKCGKEFMYAGTACESDYAAYQKQGELLTYVPPWAYM